MVLRCVVLVVSSVMTACGSMLTMLGAGRVADVGLVTMGVGMVGLMQSPLLFKRTSLDEAYAAGFEAGERKGRMVGKPVVVELAGYRRDA